MRFVLRLAVAAVVLMPFTASAAATFAAAAAVMRGATPPVAARSVEDGKAQDALMQVNPRVVGAKELRGLYLADLPKDVYRPVDVVGGSGAPLLQSVPITIDLGSEKLTDVTLSRAPGAPPELQTTFVGSAEQAEKRYDAIVKALTRSIGAAELTMSAQDHRNVQAVVVDKRTAWANPVNSKTLDIRIALRTAGTAQSTVKLSVVLYPEKLMPGENGANKLLR